jgi:hypothetical protein
MTDLTALRELVARMTPGPIYALPMGNDESDFFINDGDGNPAFHPWLDRNAGAIVAAHRLLTYLADPKAEEELAREMAKPFGAAPETMILASRAILVLLARKAMGTE